MSDVRLDRRHALRLLGGAGLGAALAACSGGAGREAAPTSTTGSSPSSSVAPTCTLTPEVMEGPFYLDLDLVRRDLTEGQPGTPLTLAVAVVDVPSCAPIGGAAVDVWHADRRGEYSGFAGAGHGTTHLRGIQLTDGAGRARFRTVYPGWYPGRSVHVHVKVHVGGTSVHTGQLFFPDDLTALVFTTAPYAARGEPDTRNEEDALFEGAGGAASIPRVSGRNGSYAAAITLGVASR